MSKVIRFDEDHFGYLVEQPLADDEVWRLGEKFKQYWPGKQLIIMVADEFIDLTGQYEIVPVKETNFGVSVETTDIPDFGIQWAYTKKNGDSA